MITPTVEELLKPSETNLSCIYKDCDKIFPHRPALNMHLTQTHKLKGYGDLSKKKKQLYLCPVEGCPRSLQQNPFTSMSTVRSHYVNMHAERNLICESCGKKISTKKRMNLHMKSCGKLFVCSFCNVPYASIEAVCRHQLSVHSAAYRRAKALKVQHSCYTVLDSESGQSLLPSATNDHNKPSPSDDAITPSSSADAAVDELSDQSADGGRSKNQSIVNDNQSIQSDSGDAANTQSDVKVTPTGSKRPSAISKTSNMSSTPKTRYVPLLPKPTKRTCRMLDMANRSSYPESKEMSTQTDVLGTAVRSSHMHLEDQCTNTTNYSQFNQAKTFANYNSQYAMYQHYPDHFSFYASNDDWNRSAVEYSSSSDQRAYSRPRYATPAHFATQTSLVESSSSAPMNSNLGTQTTLSALLEEVGESSSSIELQCDLGDAPLKVLESDECLRTMEEAMSFGTQTNLSVESQAFTNNNTTAIQSAEMSSFGTQTLSECDKELRDLVIPENFPLQHSTSDFSMQFPYQLMDFGTQTPLLDATSQLPNEFMFDDELLNDQSTGSSAQLSQSSTQTDLDFLFNHIETQTDWHI